MADRLMILDWAVRLCDYQSYPAHRRDHDLFHAPYPDLVDYLVILPYLLYSALRSWAVPIVGHRDRRIVLFFSRR